MNTILQGNNTSDEQLLITSVRTGKTEIFRVNLRWGDLKNLTRSPVGENRYPMWSPDGSQIVFTSDRAAQDTYDLYLMGADGGDVQRLTEVETGGICYFPTWAGCYIYYGYAPPKNGSGTICRVSIEGSGQSVIGDGRDPCISPDGKTLSYTRLVKKGYSLYRMDANGQNSVRLTEHENPIGAVAPIWSPDGRQLLYSDAVEDKLEIFACSAAGDNQRQLTNLGQFAASAAWSPDMQRISFRLTDHDYWRFPDAKEYVYRVKQADKRPVWMMNADGSNAHLVESLRYHCALDGSRAVWKPLP